MTTPHPKADLLRAIADGKQMQKPESRVSPKNWHDVSAEEALCTLVNGTPVRIKPETVTINGIECNQPMQEAPMFNFDYWVPDLADTKFCHLSRWTDRTLDFLRLENGLCFATAEDAAAAVRAMIAPLKLKGGTE